MKHSVEVAKLRRELPDILDPAPSAVGLEYVERISSAFDYEAAAFTKDDAWHDLDLSSIVTDTDAVLVCIKMLWAATAAGKFFGLRKDGVTYTYDYYGLVTQAASIQNEDNFEVPLGTGRVIEYNLPTAGTSTSNLIIQGWWKPAA